MFRMKLSTLVVLLCLILQPASLLGLQRVAGGRTPKYSLPGVTSFTEEEIEPDQVIDDDKWTPNEIAIATNEHERPLLRTKHARTMYLQPYGGLGNRLRVVASGLTIARIRRINLKIVWIVDETTAFFGEWDDLFSGPKLPLTTFPGGSTNHNESACPVHDITHREEFNPVFNKKWITYEGRKILCVRSIVWLVPVAQHLNWFYSTLVPAPRVQKLVDDYQKLVSWSPGQGQWVGIHVRRTDHIRHVGYQNAESGLALGKYIEVVKALLALPVRYDGFMRVFLSTDDRAVERELHTHFPDLIHVSGKKGKTAVRTTLEGTIDGLVDMLLLSKCNVLVGTYSSSFSDAAQSIGGMYYLMVGQEIEKIDGVQQGKEIEERKKEQVKEIFQ